MTLPRIDAAFEAEPPYGPRLGRTAGHAARARCRVSLPARRLGRGSLLAALLALQVGVLPAQQPVIAYRGGVIETMGPAGRIENGTVLVRGETIEAVGANVAVPDTARVVDTRGMTILPGWIDPYRVVNIAAEEAASGPPRTIVIRGRTFTIPSRGGITSSNFTRVADNYYPQDDRTDPFLRSGITHFNLVARGYGQSAVARVTPDQPESMILSPDGMLFVSLTNQTASLDIVRRNLAAVAGRSSSSSSPSSAADSPDSGNAKTGAAGSEGPTGSSRSQAGASREQWQRIHAGEEPLLINASNAATILHLLKLLEPYPNVRIALVATGGNLFQTLDQFKGRRFSLVVRPTIDLVPHTRDRVCVPCLVHQAGVDFVFSLALAEADVVASQDTPLIPVAQVVRAGLPRQVALEALTVRPARLLGLGQTHGSLEPGKSANIVVFDGDPLAPASRLREVMIAGRTVYEG